MKFKNNNKNLLFNALKIEFKNMLTVDIIDTVNSAIRSKSYCCCIARCLNSSCDICKLEFQKKHNLPDIHEIKE